MACRLSPSVCDRRSNGKPRQGYGEAQEVSRCDRPAPPRAILARFVVTLFTRNVVLVRPQTVPGSPGHQRSRFEGWGDVETEIVVNEHIPMWS